MRIQGTISGHKTDNIFVSPDEDFITAEEWMRIKSMGKKCKRCKRELDDPAVDFCSPACSEAWLKRRK